VIGMIDVDAFEKNSWQQTSFIASWEIQANAHWRHEVDLTNGTGADSHILWWQAGKTSLCFAQITCPLGGLVQYSAFGASKNRQSFWRPLVSEHGVFADCDLGQSNRCSWLNSFWQSR
jgi:hypothetical protein